MVVAERLAGLICWTLSGKHCHLTVWPAAWQSGVLLRALAWPPALQLSAVPKPVRRQHWLLPLRLPMVWAEWKPCLVPCRN